MSEKNLEKIARYGTLIFIGLIISKLIGYATRIYIARTLSPEGYGMIYLAFSVFTILTTVSIIGLNKGIQRYVAYHKGRNDDVKIKSVIVSSFKITLPISILLGIILFVLSDWISITFFSIELSPLLKVITFMLPLSMVLSVSSFTMLGMQKVKYYVYSEWIIKPLFTFIGIFGFIYIGFNVIGGIFGYLFGFVISAILSIYFLQTKVFKIFKSNIKSVPYKKELMVFSIPVFFAGILDVMINQISSLMLGSLTNFADVGIFQAAFPTAQLMIIVPTAFSTLFLPIISDLYSQRKMDEIKNLYKTLSKWIFFFIVPVLSLFTLFSDTFIRVFFGQEYIEASFSLILLSVGFMAFSFSDLSLSVLDTIKKTKLYILNSSVAAALIIVLNYFFIISYGVFGAALATTITFLVISFLRIIESYYYIKVLPFNLGFLKPILSSIISTLIIYILLGFVSSGLFTMIVFSLLYILIYLGHVLLLGGLNSDDLLILRELERKSGLRVNIIRNFIKKFVR